MVVAAVNVSLTRVDQQPLSEGEQRKRVLRVEAVALRSIRAALEDHLHVLRRVRQIRVQRRLPHTVEAFRGRQIRRHPGRHGRQRPPNEIDIERPACAHGLQQRRLGAVLPPPSTASATVIRVRVPAPVRVARLSGQHRHQTAVLRRSALRGEVGESPAGRTRRLEVHREVSRLREIGLLERVHAHRLPHHVRPPEETLHVAVPVGQALVPPPVVVTPRRVHVAVHVHRVPYPLGRLRDLVQERRSDLSKEVPGATGMAVERLPEVVLLHEQVVVHLIASCLEHLAALGAVRLGQQVVQEGVGAREVVVVRHPGFVVVPVSRRSFGVPLRAGHQDLSRQTAVLLLAPEQPRESEGGRAVERRDRVHPVAPPDHAPILAQTHRPFRIKRGLGGRRRVGHDLVRRGHQRVGDRLQVSLRPLAQGVDVLRPDEQSRVGPRDPSDQLLPLRQGQRPRLLGDGECDRPAPRRRSPVAIAIAESPEPFARRERPRWPVHRIGHVGRLVLHLGKPGIPRALDLIRGGVLLRPPHERRRRLHLRAAFRRPKSPFPRLCRCLIDLQLSHRSHLSLCPSHCVLPWSFVAWLPTGRETPKLTAALSPSAGIPPRLSARFTPQNVVLPP